jgi:CMP-N-acetylneuraminic acid synthetase
VSTVGSIHTLAVIPARGGSTRIPRKNLAPLGGRPLLAHTIQAALEAAQVDATVVSTDDDEIAEVALRLGAGLVRRPAELATSEAPTEPALQHAVSVVEQRTGSAVEVVVMLQPTSPLRDARRIDQAVELLLATGCDSVASVTPDRGYYFLGELDAEGRLALGYDPRNRLRTQEIPPRYRENGALYAMTRAQIMERGCRLGSDVRALVLTEEEGVDIDHPVDLLLCESLLRAGQRPRSRSSAPAPLAIGPVAG